jgi:peptide/nickel transport system permease protein
MGAFVLRRLAFLIVVLLGVSLITFGVMHLAPGDPVRLLAGPQADAASIERLREQLGFDRPLPQQYLAHLGRLARFDLGTSNVSGRPVSTEILARAPATLELMFTALAVALLIGVPLGMLAALRRGSLADRLVQALAVGGASIPAFWLGLLLVVVFYRELGWFPASGRFTGTPPPQTTGLLTIDALIAGDWRAFRVAWAHLALPVISLAVLDAGNFARLVRNQLLAVLGQEYIRVARALGLSEPVVVGRHAMRNALSPLVTVVTVALANLLYGSVSVETVFGWPGDGQYVVGSIFGLDFPVIMGFAVLASIAYVALNLAGDLVQAALDPRLRR